MIDVGPICDWLVDGAPGASESPEVLARLGSKLLAHGVRTARIAALVRTLHPSVIGRSFTWRRGVADVEIKEPPYAILGTPEYLRSPGNVVSTSGRELRRRLDDAAAAEFEVLASLGRDGLTDYFALPLVFMSGEVHSVTYATDAAGGFSDDELAALRAVSRPLARVAEILALRRTAIALLSAYVGRDAGERILRGQVQRGDTESIRAVIWFSDLRGFTSMSGAAPPNDIIVLLNRVFDCQVPAVERHGGQVLKFMGDGMLAIFPIAASDDADTAAPVCAAAAQADDRSVRRARRAQRHARRRRAAALELRHRAAPRRRRLRQHRRGRAARLHLHRPGGEPRRAHRRADRQARQAAPRLRGVRRRRRHHGAPRRRRLRSQRRRRRGHGVRSYMRSLRWSARRIFAAPAPGAGGCARATGCTCRRSP